jgi:heavy metal translocating P-type ATPase
LPPAAAGCTLGHSDPPHPEVALPRRLLLSPDSGLLLVAALGVAVGLALYLAGRGDTADIVWTLATLPILARLLVSIIRQLRRGETGLDIVAALSMSAALLTNETAAANVVALMYAGGTFLESFAGRRARSEMQALLARQPRTALRHTDGLLTEIPIDAIAPGDRLLVRQGDTVPTDGTALGPALLDLSALTGEPLPLAHDPGQPISSGAVNAGPPFDLAATRPAADSTYAGILRLVDAAQKSRAPMARLADRWSLGFLALTLAIAGAAWALTGDPVRATAVLVVATPCPLILAVPVALVAGLSRAARFGVLVKGGAALEKMARIHTLVLDKTGTLTEGRPALVATWTAPGQDAGTALCLAASLDQASRHPIAQALVAAAASCTLSPPTDVTEHPGEGLTGRVGGHSLAVGGLPFVHRQTGLPPPDGARTAGEVGAALAVDGRLAAIFTFADGLRPDTARFLTEARALGLSRILLATGDRADVARAITHDLALDAVHADMTPRTKLALIAAEQARGPVAMVGDGINDAPALAAADLGVAMGARGAAASAEAADVVLLVDRLDRLLPGIRIARGARAIALQSVAVGLGLSVAGMLAAAAGYLTPVQGAVLQEVIDLAVVLNALRALRIDPGRLD